MDYRCSHCHETKPAEAFAMAGSKLSYRDGRASWCRNCQKEYSKEYNQRPEVKRKAADRMARRRVNIRNEMIEAYGGKCVCCGEWRPEFLTVDHIHGGGRQERLRLGAAGVGFRFYEVLKTRGWPQDDYQLLCFNCNCAKGIRGYCPHEEER